MTRTLPRLPPVRIAEVPDQRFAHGYVNRVLANGLTEHVVYDSAARDNENVLLEGPTGSGKSRSVHSYAAKRRRYLYSVSSHNGLEPSHLFGKYIPDEDNPQHAIWQDGPVTDIIRYGGVLALSELSRFPTGVSGVLLPLLDEHREIQLVEHKGEVIRAHRHTGRCALSCDRGVLIVADMNPDYAGTHPLDEALRNRFAIQIPFDYDPAVELALVRYPKLLEMATKLRATDHIETPVSTNMLIEFVRHYTKFGMKFTWATFRTHFTEADRSVIDSTYTTMRTEIEQELSVIAQTDPYGRALDADYLEDTDWNAVGDGFIEEEEDA